MQHIQCLYCGCTCVWKHSPQLVISKDVIKMTHRDAIEIVSTYAWIFYIKISDYPNVLRICFYKVELKKTNPITKTRILRSKTISCSKQPTVYVQITDNVIYYYSPFSTSNRLDYNITQNYSLIICLGLI